MDANFPAGVLAAKLETAWSPSDFKAMLGLYREQCGDFLDQSDNPDQVVFKDVFGIEPDKVKSHYWRAAEDHRRPEDHGTPMHFWLKGSDGGTVAEQLPFVDGVYGSTKRISGN